MARVPINLSKVYTEYGTGSKKLNERFQLELVESGEKWKKTVTVNRVELLKFRDKINDLLGYESISKLYSCSLKEAEKISEYNSTESICTNCKQKNISCYDCIFICQSPLEQSLMVSLRDHKLNAALQWRINKDGYGYPHQHPIDKANILTIPDFYIETKTSKICIYADGHTYHERTENQALRDRNIDRELQNLGYKVLRFTGKEIRQTLDKVVSVIMKNLD